MIIYGDQTVEFPSNISFGRYVLDQMQRAPKNDVCLENGITGETMTYKNACQFIVNLVFGLSKLGVKTGDVVAIGSEPFVHAIPTILAITITGATSTAYESGMGRAVFKHKLQLAKPKYLICSTLFWQEYEEVLKNYDSIKTYIAISDIPEMAYSLKSVTAVDVDVESFEPSNVQGKTDTALIFFSSGTTGMPKGVEISHYAAIASLFPIPLQMKKAFLMINLLSNYGIYATSSLLLLGKKVVISTKNTTEMHLMAIQNCKVDLVFAYPLCFNELVTHSEMTKKQMDSVKMLFCGAFPLRASTIQIFKERFPNIEDVFQVYGANEIGVVTLESYAPAPRPGSVGVVLPGMIVKVVDPTTEAILGPNQPGEIRVKGAALMKGYIGIDRINYLDEDGFYKTGDMGYFDDDKYFYIIDRLTDIIYTRLCKICPQELESLLLQHPAVKGAGVIGKPDPVVNEVPMAFVVKNPGYDVTESELMDFVAAEVTPVMQLKGGVRFIQELPISERGKLLRRELRKMLEKST